MFKILVLNLGSTSSKVAVYEDLELLADATLRHSESEMRAAPTAADQIVYRKKLITDWLGENNFQTRDFAAIAARGATIPEAHRGGTYLVAGRYRDLLMELFVPDKPLIHGNRIITPISLSLASETGAPVYITDPSSVNEMTEVAKISGLKGSERRGRFHALNQKMVARRHAANMGKAYKDCRFVVAHMGGGISVGAHRDGLVVDANDAGEGYGPFTADRAGTVATEVMLALCYERGLSQAEAHRVIRGDAGLMSHLGTADLREAERMADSGDSYAALVIEALFYQIAKEVGHYAACLNFDLDAVILTGGMAHSERLVKRVGDRVGKLAPLAVYPGEFENEALARGALRVLTGEEKPIVL
ncbi:MAG: butyrate kinase [Deltaproteobacteria bacterium]|jgi:butyrate kinase|nr:butyrate kinase [Deltaproteobacteria bacterium]